MEKAKLSIGAAVIGLLSSLVALLTGCVISAWLIHKGTVDMDRLGYLVLGLIFLTGIVGGTATLMSAKTKILIVGCVVGALVFLVLLSAGILFFEGKTTGVGQTVLLLMGVIVSTILVGTHRSRKPKPHRGRVRTG